MKNILSLIFGVILIIFSNVILNFFPTSPKIEPILIYVILLAIFSNQNNFYLLFLAFLFGFLQDSSVGRYSSMYTIAFFSIMLVASSIRYKIQREYFSVTFFLSLAFVLVSTIFFSIVSGSVLSILDIAKISIIYIIKTMIVISILLFFITKMKRRRGI